VEPAPEHLVVGAVESHVAPHALVCRRLPERLLVLGAQRLEHDQAALQHGGEVGEGVHGRMIVAGLAADEHAPHRVGYRGRIPVGQDKGAGVRRPPAAPPGNVMTYRGRRS
jgi:hypothetical protein